MGVVFQKGVVFSSKGLSKINELAKKLMAFKGIKERQTVFFFPKGLFGKANDKG